MKQHWYPLPFNNNRTAYRPFGLPMLFVIPASRDGGQGRLPYQIDIKVLDVPRFARVIGHDNAGRLYPESTLYTETIQQSLLAARMTYVSDGLFSSRSGLEYRTNIRNGYVIDLTDILIDFSDLNNGEYILSYEATIDLQVLDSNDLVICSNTNERSVIVYKNNVFHPGDVLAQLVSNVPNADISSNDLKTEPIIDMMRPFCDVLQDISDEQDVLRQQAYPTDCSPFMISQLSDMLGWSLPQITQDDIGIFRKLLRSTAKIQKIRGSIQAFNYFFNIYNNLVSIRYHDDNGILATTNIKVIEPCLPPLLLSKFQRFTVPLRRSICISSDDYITSTNKVTIYAIGFVNKSDAESFYEEAQTIITGTFENTHNDVAFQLPAGCWITRMTYDDSIVYKEVIFGNSLISSISLSNDAVDIRLDGDLSWTGRYLVLLAAYQSVEYNELYRNNDIDLKLSGDGIPNQSYEFVLNQIKLLKPAHTRVNKLDVPFGLIDGYVLNDVCYGPELSRTIDSDIGKFEVPFGKIVDYNGCISEIDRFTLNDIRYREKLTSLILEQFSQNELIAYIDKQEELSVDSFCDRVISAGWRSGFIGRKTISQQFKINPNSCYTETNISYQYEVEEDVNSLSAKCFKSNAEDNIYITTTNSQLETFDEFCGFSKGQHNYYTIKRKNSTISSITPSNRTFSTNKNVLCEGRNFLDDPCNAVNVQYTTKHNLAFPGCRPISMSNLRDRYVSDIYMHRYYDFGRCEQFVGGYFSVKPSGVEADIPNLSGYNYVEKFVHSVFTNIQLREYDYGLVYSQDSFIDEVILFNYDNMRSGEIGMDDLNGYPSQFNDFDWVPTSNFRDYDDPINMHTFQVKLSSCVYDGSLGYKMSGCLENDSLDLKVKLVGEESFITNQAILDGSITI